MIRLVLLNTLFICSVCITSHVLATDFGATTDGDWNDAGIWTPAGGPPDAGDRGFIGSNIPGGSASIATVTLTANQSAQSVTLGNSAADNGTLDLASFVLSLSDTLTFGSGIGNIVRTTGHFETVNLTIGGSNTFTLDANDTISARVTVNGPSQLTQAVPLNLTNDLRVENGGTLDAAGQDIVANRIFIGNFQAGGTLLNDAAITTSLLQVEDSNFAIDANDLITDLTVKDGTVTLDPATQVRDLALTQSSMSTINATSVTRNATVNAGSQLTLAVPLTLTNDLRISNGGIVDAAGKDIVANRIFIGNFQAGGTLLNDAAITASFLQVENSNFNLDANDLITDLTVNDGTVTLDPTTQLRDLTLTQSSMSTINATSVTRNATVNAGSQLTLAVPLTLTNDLRISNGGIVDAAGLDIVANRIFLGNFQAGGTLLNDAAITANDFRVQKGNFTLDADDLITDLTVTEGTVTLDPATQVEDLTLNNNSTLTTINATSVNQSASVSNGSLLTLVVPLTLTGDLNVPNGGTVDAAGLDIVANRIFLGNFQAGGTLLNDAAITTNDFRVQKGNFTLDSNDTITDLRVTDGTVTLDASTQVEDLTLSQNGFVTTINATSVNRSASVSSSGQLTLAAPLTLTSDLSIPNGGTVDAAGHAIVANRILLGNFQVGGNLLNDGAINANELRLEKDTNLTLTGANDVLETKILLSDTATLTYQQGVGETLGLSLNGNTLDILDTSVLTLEFENIAAAHYVSSFQWKNPAGGDRIVELQNLIAGGQIVISSTQAAQVGVFVGSFGYTHIGFFNSTPGDYDRNGVVEAADYDLWKSDFGTAVASPGFGSDGNFDGIVNAADYTVWLDNLGTTFPAIGSSATVPEPTSLFLLSIAGVGLLLGGWTTRRDTSS